MMKNIVGNNIIYSVFLLTLLWCCAASAKDTNNDTTTASGAIQIVVSPINILMDLSELTNANVLAIDKDGNPIEGHKLSIIPVDKSIASVIGNNFSTNESGYCYFSIFGKQQGDTTLTISDGVIASQINISVKDLLHYVLPYFYGNMELNLINPIEDINYVKIQFHENSDRFIPPVIIMLDSKEMKTIRISEELNTVLKDGWAEILSTGIIFGGVWTSKGYLPFNKAYE